MPLCDRGRQALVSVSELSLPPPHHQPLRAPPSLPINVPLEWARQAGQGVGSEHSLHSQPAVMWLVHAQTQVHTQAHMQMHKHAYKHTHMKASMRTLTLLQ